MTLGLHLQTFATILQATEKIKASLHFVPTNGTFSLYKLLIKAVIIRLQLFIQIMFRLWIDFLF